jgi:phage terminase Nu1 subunit (DNA packaging protein)
MALAPQVTVPLAFEQLGLASVRAVQAPVKDAESGAERIDTVAVAPAGIVASSAQTKRLMILPASAESNFDEVSEPLAGKKL